MPLCGGKSSSITLLDSTDFPESLTGYCATRTQKNSTKGSYTLHHVTLFHVTPHHVTPHHVTLYQSEIISGEGFTSPRSTRFTASFILAWVGAATLDSMQGHALAFKLIL